MEDQKPTRKLSEALPERFMKKVLESVGEVFDKKLGRKNDESSGLTISSLTKQLKRDINARIRNEGQKGVFAPHLLKLKLEWGTHSEVSDETIRELENEILIAAIEHINNNRYRTLDKVRVETSVDIFTKGITITPTFGEFEEDIEEEKKKEEESSQIQNKLHTQSQATVKFTAKVLFSNASKEVELAFQIGGKRLSVGRAKDNELFIDNPTVSKVHAVMFMNQAGQLLVSDTGSTNGTSINGVTLNRGEAQEIKDGDVVSFGEIEVRFLRQNV